MNASLIMTKPVNYVANLLSWFCQCKSGIGHGIAIVNPISSWGHANFNLREIKS